MGLSPLTRFRLHLFCWLKVACLPAFLQRRRKPGAFHVYAKEDLAAGTELLFEYTDAHIYGKLYWYEKLCIMTRGVWEWLVMQ